MSRDASAFRTHVARRAPWLFGAAVGLLGLLIWEWFPPGIWHDDGVYVLLGRALADGEGLSYSGVSGGYPATKFPPLFPLVLSLVWLLSPSFPENTALLTGINLLFTAAGGGLFVGYARKALGLPLPLVLISAALAWLSPGLWRLALIPLSEPLFLLLLILGFWVAAEVEGRGGRGRWVLFFLAVAGLLHTRSIGMALLAGIIGALVLRGRKLEAGGSLLAGVAMSLPWILWSRGAARTIPEPLQDALGPYLNWLGREVTRDPRAYLAFLPENALHLLARVISLLLPGVGGATLWVGVLLLPALLVGLRALGRRSLSLPLTLAVALGLLLLWPYRDIRLLLPFQPFAVLGVVVGLRVIHSHDGLGIGPRLYARIVGVGWVFFFVSASVLRLGTGWPSEAYQVRAEKLAAAVRAVAENTPTDAVVGAPELWAGIQLFTGRAVTPSARFRPLGADGPSWGTPREQYELWIEAGVTHILVEQGGEIHGEALDRVDALCPPGTVRVLDMEPGQFLVELAWDEGCQREVLAPVPAGAGPDSQGEGAADPLTGSRS